MLRHQQHPMSHHQPSYGAGPSSAHLQYQPQHSRKRSRPHDELQLDLQGLSGLTDVNETGNDIPVELTPHGRHAQPQQNLYQHPVQPLPPPPQHHHHRLPNQPPPSKMRRVGYGESPPPQHHGPPSVVGQEGMPPPAPRPRGPKLKFTPEDDQLLVDLKEKKNLTWKQIADFFPGRSSGTLQVRYCTKLKAKTTVWTDEMVRCMHSRDSGPFDATVSLPSCNASRMTRVLTQDNRCKSFAIPCVNTKTTVGASSQQKSAAVSLRRRAKKRRRSWRRAKL
jgi:hypothetical protein